MNASSISPIATGFERLVTRLAPRVFDYATVISKDAIYLGDKLVGRCKQPLETCIILGEPLWERAGYLRQNQTLLQAHWLRLKSYARTLWELIKYPLTSSARLETKTMAAYQNVLQSLVNGFQMQQREALRGHVSDAPRAIQEALTNAKVSETITKLVSETKGLTGHPLRVAQENMLQLFATLDTAKATLSQHIPS